MAYVVDAPLVLAQDQAGRVHHCYLGAVIPWLPDELAEHLLGLGMVHEIDADEPAAADDEPQTEDGKPAEDAQKPVLIAWLVKNALDEDGNDYTKSKLNPLNKAALWELINAVEDSDVDSDEGADGSDGAEG